MEVMETQLRALVGARVSVVRGLEKVSHIAQHEAGFRWAEANSMEVVGTFEDLDVSAAYDPWSRPDLGQWLTDEKADHWDVIIWSKIDRAFRSIRDSVRFAEWAKERRKLVVFAEDGLKLNYQASDSASFESMLAELFVYLGAFFGQLELNRFKTRALNAHSVIRQTTRWMTGKPPFGFRIVPHPSGVGHGLDTEPESRSILHDMARKLLVDDWSLVRITKWATETTGSNWTTTNVIRVLTTPATQGYKTRASANRSAPGEVVLDSDGEPIRMAPPTFDQATWEQIQQAVAIRKNTGKRRRHTANPMVGVGVCGRCGATLFRQYSTNRDKTKTYRTYRCGRTPNYCKGISMRADEADKLLEDRFLSLRGDSPVVEQRFVPGSDNREEIERTRGSLERLRAESDAGLITDNDEYIGRLKALTARLQEMEKEPYTASRWEPVETDKTYGEAWAETDDTEQRRKMLIDAGVRFVLHQGSPLRADVQVP